jgi:hypothetical protein
MSAYMIVQIKSLAHRVGLNTERPSARLFSGLEGVILSAAAT